MNYWQRAKEIDARVNKLFVVIAGFVIFYPVFGITADVIGRYCFNKPIPGTAEIITAMVVFMIYFSLAYSLTQGSFAKVEMLTRFFPARIKLFVELFTQIIFFIIFGLIFWQATELAIVSTIKLEYTWGLINVPLYPSKWGVSVGFFLVVVRIIFDIGDILIAIHSAKGVKP